MNSLIVFVAQYAIFIVPLLIILAYITLPPGRRTQLIVNCIIGALLGYMMLRLAASAFYDPRPFTTPGVHALFSHTADNGFPSDHATSSALMAFIVLAYSRKIGITLIGLSLLIGAARVSAHVHSWIDIFGAVIIASAAAIIAYFISRAIVSRPASDNKRMDKETS